ncbi:ATP-binding protein [bacterium]|nr:ATP-binding protein [candidate division CSSED10-310 bacterium]
MTIAVASGKGGTGKTTVAVNLALAVSSQSDRVRFLDCDVEEPNGHIFLKPVYSHEESVQVLIPSVNTDLCIHCSKCSDICQFNAIMDVRQDVLVFSDLCHSCGGCKLICPVNAISEIPKAIGTLRRGAAGSIDYIQGEMYVGHPMPVPVVRAVKKNSDGNGITIIDVPPGTSCPVVASLNGADYVILVTEPTPFGLNDLKLAVELVKTLDLPFGIVINRDGMGNNEIDNYCTVNNIPIIMRIPDDRRIAEAYSRGIPLIQIVDHIADEFRDVFCRIGDQR